MRPHADQGTANRDQPVGEVFYMPVWGGLKDGLMVANEQMRFVGGGGVGRIGELGGRLWQRATAHDFCCTGFVVLFQSKALLIHWIYI